MKQSSDYQDKEVSDQEKEWPSSNPPTLPERPVRRKNSSYDAKDLVKVNKNGSKRKNLVVDVAPAGMFRKPAARSATSDRKSSPCDAAQSMSFESVRMESEKRDVKDLTPSCSETSSQDSSNQNSNESDGPEWMRSKTV